MTSKTDKTLAAARAFTRRSILKAGGAAAVAGFSWKATGPFVRDAEAARRREREHELRESMRPVAADPPTGTLLAGLGSAIVAAGLWLWLGEIRWATLLAAVLSLISVAWSASWRRRGEGAYT